MKINFLAIALLALSAVSNPLHADTTASIAVVAVNATTSYRTLALIEAARNNDYLMVEELLRFGANPNIVAEDGGTTALIEAARNGHYKIVTLLLRWGAQPNIVGTTHL